MKWMEIKLIPTIKRLLKIENVMMNIMMSVIKILIKNHILKVINLDIKLHQVVPTLLLYCQKKKKNPNIRTQNKINA